MNGFYIKKGGRRVPLSTFSTPELEVVRENLRKEKIALQTRLAQVQDSLIEIEWEQTDRKDKAAKERIKKPKVHKVRAAAIPAARKFKEA